jgi:exosortase/archaeosortase family protein
MWNRLRFPLLFSLWLAAFSLVGQSAAFRSEVRQPLCRALAAATAFALRVVGIDAGARGDQVTAGGFSAVVHTDCDGIVLLGLFLAAVLAFPSGWRPALLPATALGVGVLVILNWFRVVALVLTGWLNPSWFEATHVYAWQGLLVLGTMVVWIVWARHAVRWLERSGTPAGAAGQNP